MVVILSTAKDLPSAGKNGVTQQQILRSLRSLRMTAFVPAMA
jgi:hypothetical protein